jgi:flagellar hook-associated protein 2
VRFDDDTDTPDIAFVDREGTLHEVDLSGLTTVGGLIARVSAETGGKITLSITDGDHLTVTSVPGASLLKVLGAGDNSTDAAEDLGILEEDGVAADSFEGDVIPATIDQAAAATIGDVIDRINAALGSVSGTANLVASIAADGKRLQLADTSGGAGTITVTTTAGNDRAAIDLGLLETSGAASPLTGDRIIGSLGAVLVRSLNGGSGLDGATTLSITNRAGENAVLDLSAHETLEEIVDAIAAAGIDVTAEINADGTGLVVTDSSGGSASNLIIAGDAAAALGIAANVAEEVVEGTNLQRQYVSAATRLSDLNYGRGIGTGSFRITDGLGESAVISIGGDEETVADVIAEINSRGLALSARINDTGDGLLIETDLADPTDAFVPIKVETVNGTAAVDLNILGESEEVQSGFIDGSYEIQVDLDVNDTLDEVVEKINDAGANVSASVIDTGTGAAPFRLNLTSAISGRAGDLVIDAGGVDLGLTALARGEDAKVFFGADDPADGFLLTSGTNSIEGVIAGVTIDLVSASDEPVTLTVARNEEAVVDAVRQLVVTFNDVIGRIEQYDFYDVESEQRGVLLGDPTLARVRSGLYRIATGSPLNVDGPFRALAQIGVGFDGDGQMTFDESKFREVYARDPDGVEDFIATYDVTVGGTSQPAAGVTITSDETRYNALGIGSLFDRLLDDLTNSVNGIVTKADDAFGSQIELIQERIETLDERLTARREQLTAQFTAMEAALARLQSQSNALSALAANLSAAQSLARSRS